MGEGEVRIFFLIDELISFQNKRTLLGPNYGYQLSKYSIAKVIKVSKEDSYISTWKTKMAFASDRVS